MKYQWMLVAAMMAMTGVSMAEPLTNGAWEVVSVGTSLGQYRALDKTAGPITVNIEDGKISGFAGCNRYFGNLTTSDRNIQIGAVATTRKLCPESTIMEREGAFVKFLSEVKTFSQTSTYLFLRTADSRSLFLKRAATKPVEKPVVPVVPEVKPVEKPVTPTTPSATTSKLINVIVGSETVSCQGVVLTECLMVSTSSDPELSLWYSGIEGFTYQAGYTYELQVREEKIANPPADGSSIRWTLVKVISKIKAQ